MQRCAVTQWSTRCLLLAEVLARFESNGCLFLCAGHAQSARCFLTGLQSVCVLISLVQCLVNNPSTPAATESTCLAMSASPALRFVLASGDLSAAWNIKRYSHDKYCVSFNNSVVVVHIHIYIYTYTYTYTYIYLSVCLSVGLSVCLSLFSVCLFVYHPSIQPSIHPSVNLSLNLPCELYLQTMPIPSLTPESTHLHRGVAARIKDLARPNVQNRAASVEECCLVRIMKAIRNVMKTRNINQKKWDTQLICKYIYIVIYTYGI